VVKRLLPFHDAEDVLFPDDQVLLALELTSVPAFFVNRLRSPNCFRRPCAAA